jgi:competence protein ComEC
MKTTLFFIHFWLCHPALLYGIAFLLGLFCHFESSFWLIIPCLSLWLPFLIAAFLLEHRDILKPLALSFLTFCTAWGTATIHYSFPPIPDQGISGKAYVRINTIDLQHSLFGERWLYHCELRQFFPENSSHSIVSSLPCLMSLPAKQMQTQSRPLANRDYWVTGKLIQTDKGSFLLKISSKTPWTTVQNSWNWAEQRYQWKRRVGKWIESQFSYPLSGSFLAGLATGEFDDYWMRQQFTRFGLQHLLAISGFHFAIIAGFLSFLLRLFFSQRIRIVSLLIFLGMYCFFLGPQASILRAWIMCSLTLIGSLIDKQTTALNSLGFALLAILGYNPLLCQELGFQLSFATTAAILLFYQPAQAWLYELFPKRRLSDVMQMNQWNQHGYCVLAFFRQGLALSLAVNVFALPLTLYYFHQFPWISLLYNLFFPFLATGSLCLLLLGGLLVFIPFLAEILHHLNDVYTFFLLQFTYQVPSEMDAYLTSESFHPFWLVLYFCFATLGGIIWKEKQTTHSEHEIFTFI